MTFARIDMAARKERILGDDGSGAAEGEHTPLSSFVGRAYELDFAIDGKLGDGVVSLIHDADPDGGASRCRRRTDVEGPARAANVQGSG